MPGSDLRSQPRTLIDGALGIQFSGHIRTADQVHGLARRFQTCLQFTQRLLAGAEDDGIHRQHTDLVAATDMQSGVVDLQVFDAIEHLHLLGRQTGTVDPAGGLATKQRSEEHTSELQSRPHLVCRLLLEKKKTKNNSKNINTKKRNKFN